MSVIWYKVLASADDGYIYPPSGFDSYEYYPFFGYYEVSDYKLQVFSRFSNINIPKGAKITQAYVSFGIYPYVSGTINARVYACDEDNSAAVTSYSNYNAKPVTTAYTDWQIVITTIDSWRDIQSGSLVNIIQEIVNRSGWTAGNHLQLLIKVQSTVNECQVQTECYEVSSNATDAMRLYIEWSVPKATATATMKTPGISISENVNAVSMTASAVSIAPSISISASVNSVVMTANAEMGNHNYNVGTVIVAMTASGILNAPNFQINEDLNAVSMTASATMKDHNIRYGYTINATPMAANAKMEDHNVVAGIIINAISMTANGLLNAPSYNNGYSVYSIVMESNEAMNSPDVHGGIGTVIVAMTASAKMEDHNVNYGYSVYAAIMESNAKMEDHNVNYGYCIYSVVMESSTKMEEHKVSYGWSIDSVTMTANATMKEPTYNNDYSVYSIAMTGTATMKDHEIHGGIGTVIVAMTASGTLNAPTYENDYSVYSIAMTASGILYAPTVTSDEIVQIICPSMTAYGGMCVSNQVDGIPVMAMRGRFLQPRRVEEKYLPSDIIISVPGYFYKNRYETFKYELLTLSNGKYVSSGFITDYIQSGSLNLNFDRDIVGTAKFCIRNNDDINYMTDLIRPFYIVNNEYEFAMGTYMLTNPAKESDGKLITREINAYDLLLALDQDKTITSYSISSGTTITDEIMNILDSVGSWVNYNIVESTQTLPDNINYELGKSKLFIINSLLNMLNYYPLCVSGRGVYLGIPWNENKNLIWTYQDNSTSIYEPGITQDIDYSEMFNRVVVINNQLQEDTAPLYKVWTLEDEGLAEHPFSYTSIGRYVTKKFDSEAVSQNYIDLRAKREIRKLTEIEEAIIYKHMFAINREGDGLPRHGDAYEFKNSLLDVSEVYSINSQQYNLKLGNSIDSTIKKVRSAYI